MTNDLSFDCFCAFIRVKPLIGCYNQFHQWSQGALLHHDPAAVSPSTWPQSVLLLALPLVCPCYCDELCPVPVRPLDSWKPSLAVCSSVKVFVWNRARQRGFNHDKDWFETLGYSGSPPNDRAKALHHLVNQQRHQANYQSDCLQLIFSATDLKTMTGARSHHIPQRMSRNVIVFCITIEELSN